MRQVHSRQTWRNSTRGRRRRAIDCAPFERASRTPLVAVLTSATDAHFDCAMTRLGRRILATRYARAPPYCASLARRLRMPSRSHAPSVGERALDGSDRRPRTARLVSLGAVPPLPAACRRPDRRRRNSAIAVGERARSLARPDRHASRQHGHKTVAAARFVVLAARPARLASPSSTLSAGDCRSNIGHRRHNVACPDQKL